MPIYSKRIKQMSNELAHFSNYSRSGIIVNEQRKIMDFSCREVQLFWERNIVNGLPFFNNRQKDLSQPFHKGGVLCMGQRNK